MLVHYFYRVPDISRIRHQKLPQPPGDTRLHQVVAHGVIHRYGKKGRGLSLERWYRCHHPGKPLIDVCQPLGVGEHDTLWNTGRPAGKRKHREILFGVDLHLRRCFFSVSDKRPEAVAAGILLGFGLLVRGEVILCGNDDISQAGTLAYRIRQRQIFFPANNRLRTG